jgi:integrase
MKELLARDVAVLIKEAARTGNYKATRIAQGLWVVPRKRQDGYRWFVKLRWTQHNGKEQVKALGGYRAEKLAQYLAEARRTREALREGDNPHNILGKGTVPTFREVAEAYIAAKVDTRVEAGGSKKGANNIKACIRKRYKVLGDLRIDRIEPADVIRALGADKGKAGDWARTPASGRKALRAIQWVIAYGYTPLKIMQGTNPARWENIRYVIPSQPAVPPRKHQGLPPAEVPAAFRELAATKCAGYRGWGTEALKFTMLTVARSNEVMQMRWDQINWNTKSWDRPWTMMKARLDHRIPLSTAALAMLRELEQFRRDDNPYVFQGMKRGTGLSHNALRAAMRRTKFGNYIVKNKRATPHGYRTSFVDWRREDEALSLRFNEEIVDISLAHFDDDAVRAAYKESDLLERRRPLMELWAQHVTGTTAAPAVLVTAAHAAPAQRAA